MKSRYDRIWKYIVLIIIFFFLLFVIMSILLNKNSSKRFPYDGYVITSLKKTFFKEGNKYKNGLDDTILFTNSKNKNRSIDNSSFIHYSNKSYGVFKDSYVLDLDNVNESLINYYVLPNNHQILKKNDYYKIDLYNAGFKNFLISTDDDHYMIVGQDIRLSNDNQTDKYYEIKYRNGKVYIQNDTQQYEFNPKFIDIYISNNLMFDVQTKQLCLYKENVKNCIYNLDNINKLENKTGVTNDSQTVKNNQKDKSNQIEDNFLNIKDELEPEIDMINLNLTYNGFNASLKINDPKNLIIGKIHITVTDSPTGKIIYENSRDATDTYLNLETLYPDNEYLLNIDGEYKYRDKVIKKTFIQKSFRTNSLNFSVRKEYQASDELDYKLKFKNSIVDLVNLKLIDETGNTPKTIRMQICDNNQCVDSTNSNINLNQYDKEVLIKYLNLDSNQIYTLEIDDYKINNQIYSSKYKMKIKASTLKKKPTFNQENILNINFDDNLVNVDIKQKENSTIIDNDDSLVSFRYELWENNNSSENLIHTFNKPSLTDLDITKYLKKDQLYQVKLYMTYNDNVKEVESHVVNSAIFTKNGNLMNIEYKEIDSFYEHVNGTLTLKDTDGNLVINSGYNFYLLDNDNVIGKKYIEFKDGVASISLSNLDSNREYKIGLYGEVDNFSQLLSNFVVKTTPVPAIQLEWNQNEIVNKPKQIISIDSKEDFDRLKPYLDKAEMKLINGNKEIIGKTGFSASYLNKLLTGEDINLISSLGIQNCYSNDLYSCLEPDTYILSVNIKDKYLKDIPLGNNTFTFSKAKAGTISVIENKSNGVVTGYTASVTPSNEGQHTIEIYNKNDCIVTLDTDFKENTSCSGAPLISYSPNNYSLESFSKQFKFDDCKNDNNCNQYSRGGAYIFAFKDANTYVYSTTYYPEKKSPQIKLIPWRSDESSVTYAMAYKDDDDTLNYKKNLNSNYGIFYQIENEALNKLEIEKIDDNSDEEIKSLIDPDSSWNTGFIKVNNTKFDIQNVKYNIIYKAEISELYEKNEKTKILLTDHFENNLKIESIDYDTISGFSGMKILLKDTIRSNIIGYKVNGIIKTNTNECDYDDSYTGCIFLSNSEIDKIDKISISVLYDSGLLGFNLKSSIIYQEILTDNYVKFSKEKVIKKNKNAMGMNSDNVLQIKSENINSSGIFIDNINIKPKLILESNTFSSSAKPNDFIDPGSIKLSNIKTNLNSISFDYETINYTGDLFANVYIGSPKCTSPVNCDVRIVESSVNCNDKNCIISGLNVDTEYTFSLYGKDDKNNIIWFKDYYNFDTKFYHMKTKNINPIMDVKLESGTGKEAKRLITLTINSKADSDLSGITPSVCNKSNKCINFENFEIDNNKIIAHANYSATDKNGNLNSDIIFNSIYELKLKEKDKVIYAKDIELSGLRDIEFKSVITPHNNISYKYENDDINATPYLEIDSLYIDKDGILDIENGQKYRVSLYECSSISSDKCETVVGQSKVLTSDYNSENPKIIFKNIKNNTRYKVVYNYKIYQPNIENCNIDSYDETKSNKTYEQYIYTKDKNDIISIGSVKTKVDNNYNNTNNKALVFSYYNSNLINEIDEVVYTLTNKDEIYSVKEIPEFRGYSTCISGVCESGYYQSVLNLSPLDLKSANYTIEVSYRKSGIEVDRYSGKFDYESTIYIYKVEDLVRLANKVNSGDDRANYTYVLANSIDFNNPDDYYDPDDTSFGDINGINGIEDIMTEMTTGKGFNPIGIRYLEVNSSSIGNEISLETPFSGKFDGNNKTIYNLYIARKNKTYVESGISQNDYNRQALGLFGLIQDAKIENLNIDNANIEGYTETGILSGVSIDSEIKNISVSGDIKGIQYVGGLIGRVYGNSNKDLNLLRISNCQTSGNIEGIQNVGGLVGELSGTGIYKTYSEMSINGQVRVGGLVGNISWSSLVSNSTYNGNISSTGSKPHDIGGLVGTANTNLITSSSTGTLNCTKVSKCGGIAGSFYGTAKGIFSSMNLVINNEGVDIEYIGGLFGSFINYNDITSDNLNKIISDQKYLKYSFYTGTISINGYSASQNYINGLGTLVGINGSYELLRPEYQNNGVNQSVTISKCYSSGFINGAINKTTGVGMIGINILSINNLYNGGMLNRIVNFNSRNGAIFGSSGEYVVTENGIENVANNVSNNNVNMKDAIDLNLYTIKQKYTMRNNYGVVIDPSKLSNGNKGWFYDKWYDKNDNMLTYVDGYYPKISYKGYNDRVYTSADITLEE